MAIAKERNLRSSEDDFGRFMGGTVYYDMQELIKNRINLLQAQMMSAPDSETNALIGLKHEMKAWTEMLGLVPYLKQCAHGDEHPNQLELELE